MCTYCVLGICFSFRKFLGFRRNTKRVSVPCRLYRIPHDLVEVDEEIQVRTGKKNKVNIPKWRVRKAVSAWTVLKALKLVLS